jgi:hypothetical protein
VPSTGSPIIASSAHFPDSLLLGLLYMCECIRRNVKNGSSRKTIIAVKLYKISDRALAAYVSLNQNCKIGGQYWNKTLCVHPNTFHEKEPQNQFGERAERWIRPRSSASHVCGPPHAFPFSFLLRTHPAITHAVTSSTHFSSPAYFFSPTMTIKRYNC